MAPRSVSAPPAGGRQPAAARPPSSAKNRSGAERGAGLDHQPGEGSRQILECNTLNCGDYRERKHSLPAGAAVLGSGPGSRSVATSVSRPA
jgi:hypothetical protein